MSLLYILVAAAGIGLLILAHECGHFIVAKLGNVKVENFSIGFGPEIAGFTKGETRYSLRIIPLGGYVKMLGDEPGDTNANADRAFLSQGFATKAAIIVAGSAANILLSLVLFIIVFRVGISFPAARIGNVAYESAAYYAGLQTGDRIIQIDGRSNVDFRDLIVKTALANPGQPIKLVIERGGQSFEKTIQPVFVPELGRAEIGVQPYQNLKIENFVELAPAAKNNKHQKYKKIESPAQQAGVPKGSRIVAINGQKVASWYDFRRKLTENGLRKFQLTVADGKPTANGGEKTFEITPVRSPAPLLGINPLITTKLKKVEKGSLAETMGLEAGDVITALGGTKTADLGALQHEISVHLNNLPPLEILRKSKTLHLPWPKRPSSAAAFLSACEPEVLPRVAHVLPNSPADIIGLAAGDEIMTIDGKEVKTFMDIRKYLGDSSGNSITVKWRRDGRDYAASFEPAFVGIVPGTELVTRKAGLAGACTMGARKAWDFATQVYLLLKKLVSGQRGIGKNLLGPVSIARVSYQFAQKSLIQFTFFLAIISVNLGIVNMLPIPILDGGYLAIFTVEKIKGAPLAPSTQAVVQYLGLAIIAATFLLITYQDIMRLFQ